MIWTAADTTGISVTWSKDPQNFRSRVLPISRRFTMHFARSKVIPGIENPDSSRLNIPVGSRIFILSSTTQFARSAVIFSLGSLLYGALLPNLHEFLTLVGHAMIKTWKQMRTWIVLNELQLFVSVWCECWDENCRKVLNTKITQWIFVVVELQNRLTNKIFFVDG